MKKKEVVIKIVKENVKENMSVVGKEKEKGKEKETEIRKDIHIMGIPAIHMKKIVKEIKSGTE